MDLVYSVMENLVFFLKVTCVPRSKEPKDKMCQGEGGEQAMKNAISLSFELRVPYSS